MTFQKIRLPNLNKSMAESNPNKKNEVSSKKVKQKKKTLQTPVTTPAIPAPPSPANDQNNAILQVIRDAVRIQLTTSQQKRRQVEQEMDAMVATCAEFMKSFVILGYDMEGKQIPPIICANNQQEADAIGNYLQKFLQHVIKNDGNID